MKEAVSVKWKEVWTFLRETYSAFAEDNATLFGAALAYYTFFSLAPLLIIAIAVAGAVFGAEAARGEVVAQIESVIGREGAEAVQRMLARAQESRAGLTASLVGIATLFLGATRVFTNLQTALNVMWDTDSDRESAGFRANVRRIAKKRAVSFAMVLAVGVLLLALLFASTALSAVGNLLDQVTPGRTELAELAPGPAELWLYQAFDLVLSFGVVTLLLAFIYKFLPDTRVDWRDVWFGAVATAALFTAGKFLIGWYLGSRSIDSVFGAAGSLVVVLLWVYYSAQILLFGAEMTQVFARRFGSKAQRAPAGGASDASGDEPGRAASAPS